MVKINHNTLQAENSQKSWERQWRWNN